MRKPTFLGATLAGNEFIATGVVYKVTEEQYNKQVGKLDVCITVGAPHHWCVASSVCVQCWMCVAVEANLQLLTSRACVQQTLVDTRNAVRLLPAWNRLHDGNCSNMLHSAA